MKTFHGYKTQYDYYRTSNVMQKVFRNDKLNVDDIINYRSMLSINKEKWAVGDNFTTPETGNKIFTVINIIDKDVYALDERSAAGYTIFSKTYITKIKAN